ncbi:unnamed protein product [Orchesella dallaii]|uniref:Pyruvate dehydrogenase phosphatase regulatory subunit, mitochondrial n=1 Tax=Orchesella dallaii TaxID=48710 RepID=A0ABP1QJF4_9HEXA
MNTCRILLQSTPLKQCPSRFFSKTQIVDSLPKEARVVICGTGIVGNSVAYHLVQSGWSDVVVLDQESRIGQGTSSYGSGTLALLKPVEEQKIITKSIALYKKLQAEGHDIGLVECGSLYLAQNRERMILFKRRVALNQPQGLQCKLLGPNELAEYHPLLYTSDLQGGVFVEKDAVANPELVCDTLAKLAVAGGAKYVKNCIFNNLITHNGKVAAVDTSLGTIKCQFFVNCSGMWAWDLGQRSNPKIRIPVHAVEHFYLRTHPLVENLPPDLPTIRDYDSHIYIRKLKDNSFLMGGFEKNAKPIFTNGVPDNWRDCLYPDWDHFAPMLDDCLRRMPKLKDCELQTLLNAPDTFTPDGKWILGETPEVDNYFVAVGMNGNSLQGSGGIGHSLAHWIIEGEPDIPLIEFDIRRFVDVHNNRRFLYDRVKETVGRQYDILYPLQSEYQYARKIRCSPLYSTLQAQGAVFGTRMCFERPLYFDIDYKVGDPKPQMPKGTYWKPLFFDSLKEEYKACREGVAVIDMSSFTKLQIKSASNEAMEYLQKLCSNDIDVPVGHISPTGMQNESGGYENDCMLVRQAANCFFMVAPTKQQTRIAEWMQRHMPEDNSVQISDVTSMYTVLLIIGPKSRELLSQLTEGQEDVKMHPFSYKTMSLGHAPEVMILSVTNSGEAGYSLYVPSEYAVHLYDELMKIGKDYGIRNAGYLTLRFLRLEKFVPFWGEEMDSITTPLEIGRNHRVKLNKQHFIGKQALQMQHEKGVYRRLVHFTLDDDHDAENDVWVWGGEPIFRNGVYIGSTTSGGYAFTLERMVALGFIVNKDIKTGNLFPVTQEYVMSKDALYQIDIAGRRFNVRQSLHPPSTLYDR